MNKTAKAIAIMMAVSSIAVVGTPIIKKDTKVENVKVLTKNNNSSIQGNIKINNVWNQSLFNVSIKDGILNITKGWSEVNPYARGNLVFTIKEPNGTILKTVSFKHGTYPENEAFNELNGYKLKVGNIISITSNTGSKYIINNASESKTVAYQYTGSGLKQITESAYDIKALNNGGENTKVFCKVKPNIEVTFVVNRKKTTVISNSEGLVNVNLNASIGDIITIQPYDELESTVTVKPNPNSYILQGENINIKDVWNYGIVNIGFNYNNTLKVINEGGETNPYYTGNDAMTVSLLNKNGEVISTKTFKGGVVAGEALMKELNGRKFEYGDSIQIISNSGEHINSNNKSYKGNILFKLTKKGIIAESFNNKNFSALERL